MSKYYAAKLPQIRDPHPPLARTRLWPTEIVDKGRVVPLRVLVALVEVAPCSADHAGGRAGLHPLGALSVRALAVEKCASRLRARMGVALVCGAISVVASSPRRRPRGRVGMSIPAAFRDKGNRMRNSKAESEGRQHFLNSFAKTSAHWKAALRRSRTGSCSYEL